MSTEQEVAREREKQRQHSLHQRNLQSGGSFDGTKAEYLDRLTQTEQTDAGIQMLDNMLTQDFVLSNLTRAETDEIKWRLHTMFLKIKSEFPPEGSSLQGEYRAFLFDDPAENINSMSGKQEIIISQCLIAITARVARSRDGFQQEQMVKSISVSEVVNPDKDSDSTKRGLFSFS